MKAVRAGNEKRQIKLPADGRRGGVKGHRTKALGSTPAAQPAEPAEWKDGMLVGPPGFTDAWWALARPNALSAADMAALKLPPPPNGYRYRPDGTVVPLIDGTLNIRSPEGKALFLQTLQYTGSTRAAMDSIGLSTHSRPTVLAEMDAHPDFAAGVEAAMDRHRDAIYCAAYSRAVHGYEKPIIGGPYKNEIVAHERVYSDTLAALLLKRHYQEFRTADARTTPTTVNVNQNNVTIKPGLDVRKLTKAQRGMLRQLAAPAAQAQMDIELAAETTKAIAEQDEDAPLTDVIDTNCTEK